MAAGDIFIQFKNQTDNLLRQIKKGIKEEGLNKAKEEALKRAPTPEQIQNQFINLAQENPKEAEKYYTVTKNKLESILDTLEGSRRKIEILGNKLTKIDTKINDVNEVAKTVKKFLPPIEKALLALASSISTAGAPTLGSAVSIPLQEQKIKLLSFLAYLVACVAGAVDIIETIKKQSGGVRDIIPSAIASIEQIQEFIKMLLDMLEKLYINFLLPLLEGYEEIDGGIESVEDLYNQYPELEKFLTTEGNINLSDEDLYLPSYGSYGATNGISNVPPKFYRRYRKKPYTDIY